MFDKKYATLIRIPPGGWGAHLFTTKTFISLHVVFFWMFVKKIHIFLLIYHIFTTIISFQRRWTLSVFLISLCYVLYVHTMLTSFKCVVISCSHQVVFCTWNYFDWSFLPALCANNMYYALNSIFHNNKLIYYNNLSNFNLYYVKVL